MARRASGRARPPKALIASTTSRAPTRAACSRPCSAEQPATPPSTQCFCAEMHSGGEPVPSPALAPLLAVAALWQKPEASKEYGHRHIARRRGNVDYGKRCRHGSYLPSGSLTAKGCGSCRPGGGPGPPGPHGPYRCPSAARAAPLGARLGRTKGPPAEAGQRSAALARAHLDRLKSTGSLASVTAGIIRDRGGWRRVSCSAACALSSRPYRASGMHARGRLRPASRPRPRPPP